MIKLQELEKQIKDGKLNNSYLLAGTDEALMKSLIDNITDKVLPKDLRDLNYIKLDGFKVSYEDIVNACETLPFMSEVKVVVIYRANFFKSQKEFSESEFKKVLDYYNNTPSHIVLLSYVLLDDKSDKPLKHKGILNIDKKATVVHIDRQKEDRLIREAENIFKTYNKEIGKVELRYFINKVEKNFEIIRNEIGKLVNYTEGREIKREDIDALLPSKSEEDIFDLIDFISDKKPEKAIVLMNDLVFKGENLNKLLTLIEGQFKKLYEIKFQAEKNLNPQVIAGNLKLHPFVVEKLIKQGKKFSFRQLEDCMRLCVDTEKRMKSLSTNVLTEMEFLLISTVRTSSR